MMKKFKGFNKTEKSMFIFAVGLLMVSTTALIVNLKR